MNRSKLSLGLFVSACLFSSLVLVSCGGGSSPLGEAITDPVVVNPASNTPNNTATPNTTAPAEVTTSTTNSPATFPFTGTITLDDYDSTSGTNPFLGVIDIELAPLSKKRLFNGSRPRRHANGSTVYRQSCGSRVHRIMLADENSRSTQLTPCSSTVENSGVSNTDFEFSALSPDASRVAVEAKYFVNSDYRYAVLVYDALNRNLLASWDNSYSPMWLRDGRLVVTSAEGFFVLDTDLNNPVQLQTGLTGPVNNPALHPTEDVIAFEYSQQLWLMNTDGSDAKEVVFAGSRLRYPTWSPDGTTLAYLATDRLDSYHERIYFTDLINGVSYLLDLSPVMDPNNFSNVPNGPLSWRR